MKRIAVFLLCCALLSGCKTKPFICPACEFEGELGGLCPCCHVTLCESCYADVKDFPAEEYSAGWEDGYKEGVNEVY